MPEDPETPIADVFGLRREAHQARDAGKHRQAYDKTGAALSALGDRYRDAATIDDTGMRALAAARLLREGRIEDAARLLDSVLADRIALYQRRDGLSKDGASVCPSCGSGNPERSGYCSHCGTELGGAG